MKQLIDAYYRSVAKVQPAVAALHDLWQLLARFTGLGENDLLVAQAGVALIAKATGGWVAAWQALIDEQGRLGKTLDALAQGWGHRADAERAFIDVKVQLEPVARGMHEIAGALRGGQPASACRARCMEVGQRVAKGSRAVQEWLKWLTYAVNEIAMRGANEAMRDVNYKRAGQRPLTEAELAKTDFGREILKNPIWLAGARQMQNEWHAFSITGHTGHVLAHAKRLATGSARDRAILEMAAALHDVGKVRYAQPKWHDPEKGRGTSPTQAVKGGIPEPVRLVLHGATGTPEHTFSYEGSRDHATSGANMAFAFARQQGFDAGDARKIATLVAHHDDFLKLIRWVQANGNAPDAAFEQEFRQRLREMDATGMRDALCRLCLADTMGKDTIPQAFWGSFEQWSKRDLGDAKATWRSLEELKAALRKGKSDSRVNPSMLLIYRAFLEGRTFPGMFNALKYFNAGGSH